MKLAIATTLFALSLSAAAAQPPARPGADEKSDSTPLAGAYTIVSGERHGKALPAEEVKGAIVTFADGKIIGKDKDKNEFYTATYKLDQSQKPWRITMKTTSVGGAGDKEPKELPATTGLVKKEGDTVTIIYALPGGEEPKDFKTGEKQQLFVLKSEKSSEKPHRSPPNPDK